MSSLADFRSTGVGEMASDPVRFLNGQFPDSPELRAAIRQRASDVEMEVRDGLVCSGSVVLPDGDAWAFVGVVNRGGGGCDGVDERVALFGCCLEKGRVMAGRNNKDMANATLFSGDKDGDEVRAAQNSETSPTGEVVTECARIFVRDLDAVVIHHAANEDRNDWNSKLSILCCSDG
jgi:hypothetical protein